VLDLWWRYVDGIEWLLVRLTEFTGSGGLAIILFTIALKTLLLPLTVKSIRSTAAMQELQPKVKELQKKYAKDRPTLNQELMRLYSEYEINPAAGCLPLLIQIPIFFGLFYAVRDLSQTAGDFLWLSDLAKPDPLYILPVTAGIFQFIQTMMMRPREGFKSLDPQQQMMQNMMMFMPIMVVLFGINFASGAVLYWATQSVYSVVQQWLITGWGKVGAWFPWLPELPEHRRLGHQKKPLERKELGPDYQPKGFMAKMQKRAQEMEEARAARMEAAGRVPPSRGAGGKQARTNRAASGVGNVSGGSNGDHVDEQQADTRASTRVMSSKSRSAAKRARNNGRGR
jgi:YidC/Oxa1 family membrane protein insertase